jgi:hypothetical protein
MRSAPPAPKALEDGIVTGSTSQRLTPETRGCKYERARTPHQGCVPQQ